MNIVQPSVILIEATPRPEQKIEESARICYQSQDRIKRCEHCNGLGYVPQNPDIDGTCPTCGGYGTDRKSAEKFVRTLLGNNHESVIEHVSASFMVICDRGVSHEIVRHRLSSFSQESTRYCDYMKPEQCVGGAVVSEIKVIRPPSLERYEAFTIWKKAMEYAEKAYMDLRSLGIKPEIARSVLPTGLKTQLSWTANAREWRHIMKLRTSKKAHPQMREIALIILTCLYDWCPVLFEDIMKDVEGR